MRQVTALRGSKVCQNSQIMDTQPIVIIPILFSENSWLKTD